jgi:hypothetical protein
MILLILDRHMMPLVFGDKITDNWGVEATLLDVFPEENKIMIRDEEGDDTCPAHMFKITIQIPF